MYPVLVTPSPVTVNEPTTWLVMGSIWAISGRSQLPTQSEPPPTAIGYFALSVVILLSNGSWIVATTWLVTGSMRSKMSLRVIQIEPSAAARLHGRSPTAISATRSPTGGRTAVGVGTGVD